MKQFYSLKKDNEYKSCKMFFYEGGLQAFLKQFKCEGFCEEKHQNKTGDMMGFKV